MPEPFQEATVAQVYAMQKVEMADRKKRNALKRRKLKAMGFEGELGEEAVV